MIAARQARCQELKDLKRGHEDGLQRLVREHAERVERMVQEQESEEAVMMARHKDEEEAEQEGPPVAATTRAPECPVSKFQVPLSILSGVFGQDDSPHPYLPVWGRPPDM